MIGVVVCVSKRPNAEARRKAGPAFVMQSNTAGPAVAEPSLLG
jgi:hypothetical protein